MTDWLIPTLTVVGLLLAAFGAIGSKTLLHFSHRRLEILSQSRRKRERFGQILDLHDEAALAAESVEVLGLTLFAVFGISWIGFAIEEVSAWRTIAMIVGITLAVVFVKVWLPWAITRHAAAAFLLRTWPVWLVLYRVSLPMAWIGQACDTAVRRLTGRPRQAEREADGEALEDEIMTMVTAGQREGLLQEDALEMIEGVFELDDSDVADIMTPRSKVSILEADIPWDLMLQHVIETGHTRLPVCESKTDRVVGILYAKDLLAEWAKGPDQPRAPLEAIVREPIFFPRTLPLNDALQRFLQSRKHLAIVNDEFDGFIGVVTIEDVLEEIVGEIDDEYDKQEQREFIALPDGSFEAMATIHLDDLSEELGLDFGDADDFDTLGGLVTSQLGRIPQAGEMVHYENLAIRVLQANPRHVERLRIKLSDESEVNRA